MKPELAMLQAALKSDGGRGALRDAKTLLQERVQARGAGASALCGHRAERAGASAAVQGGGAHRSPEGAISVLASAEGASKKEAQQKAAELALKHWKEQQPLESTQEERGRRMMPPSPFRRMRCVGTFRVPSRSDAARHA